MLRFATDGRRVHVFDRRLQKFRLDVPRNVAVEHEFNTVITKDGTKERWPEARLAELDAVVVPCLGKLETGYTLTREERWYVSFFIGFAETRGKGFRESVRALCPSDFTLNGGFINQRFADALSAVTGIWLDPSTIERLVREDTANIASGVLEIGSMVEVGLKMARHFFWMDWLIGVAPPGNLFLTSDRPLGLLRPGRGFEKDPFEAGVIKVFPISPLTALFIGDLTESPSVTRETVANDLV